MENSAVITTMPKVISLTAAKLELVTTVVAIIIENSPLEDRKAPILLQLILSDMSRPTHQPTPILPAIPRIEKAIAAGNTLTTSTTEMLKPKNKKKIAENISLSGANLLLNDSATSPVRSIPIRNAAMAPENPARVAAPAAAMVAPNTSSNKTPGPLLARDFKPGISRPMAITKMLEITARATETET